MAKKKSLSDIIKNYLLENPSHTWKDASASLSGKGISESYFCNYKSALRREGTLPPSTRKNAAKGKVKKTLAKGSAKSSANTWNKPKTRKAAGGDSDHGTELIEAVRFARAVGGLENAQQLLSELEHVQV